MRIMATVICVRACVGVSRRSISQATVSTEQKKLFSYYGNGWLAGGCPCTMHIFTQISRLLAKREMVALMRLPGTWYNLTSADFARIYRMRWH